MITLQTHRTFYIQDLHLAETRKGLRDLNVMINLSSGAMTVGRAVVKAAGEFPTMKIYRVDSATGER